MPTALLFTRDHVDEIGDWPVRLPRLGRSSILWIDLDSPGGNEIAELVEKLDLEHETRERLERNEARPFFGEYGSYMHVTSFAPSGNCNARELVKVDCLVARKWVVTVHEEPVGVLEEFRERTEGSGDIGKLDGPEFLGDLLEWVLNGYLAAFEAVELELEEFDARVMSGEFHEPEDELEHLVHP